ncbi:endonuclease NucS [Microcoleus sp. A2-C5]|uniref:endonuclease NucS domain-containing protein n=1 Tax=unclassified Microcoleus TaxID=2642155 RepID=UPI002FD2B5E3
MLSNADLRKTGTGWEFVSEEAVEDFVEAHLESLLGLTVIKRQFTVNEQRCDIIAVDENKQLVVVELKNGEDRYIVQQLTRYYHALLEHKPFADRVDYALPVRLVAIAPSFHRDSFTDRKYNHLLLQFLQFAIVLDGEKLYLQLKDVDAEHIARVGITYREQYSNETLSEPPRLLLKFIKQYNETEREGVLSVRRQILGCDRRIKEITDSSSIKYGLGKNKLIAEFRFDPRRNSPAMFLWLPLPRGYNNNKILARMKIWTNWEIVTDTGYIRKGIGIMINEDEYKLGLVTPSAKLMPDISYRALGARDRFVNDPVYRDNYVMKNLASYVSKYGRNYRHGSPLAMSITYYFKIIGKSDESTFLERIVNLALESRLVKL